MSPCPPKAARLPNTAARTRTDISESESPPLRASRRLRLSSPKRQTFKFPSDVMRRRLHVPQKCSLIDVMNPTLTWKDERAESQHTMKHIWSEYLLTTNEHENISEKTNSASPLPVYGRNMGLGATTFKVQGVMTIDYVSIKGRLKSYCSFELVQILAHRQFTNEKRIRTNLRQYCRSCICQESTIFKASTDTSVGLVLNTGWYTERINILQQCT